MSTSQPRSRSFTSRQAPRRPRRSHSRNSTAVRHHQLGPRPGAFSCLYLARLTCSKVHHSMTIRVSCSAAAERLDRLVKAALKAGADAADAVEFKNVSHGVSYRLGMLEDVERAESSDLGLRVFVGRQVAFVSATDFSREALAELPERAVAIAKLAPEDKFAGLAPSDLLAKTLPSLDIDDADEPSNDTLVERARAGEDAALAVAGVTNSEGGGASYGRTLVTLATSEGFVGGYAGTSHSVSVSVIAGEGAAMERDHDYASARHGQDLEAAAVIGKRAVKRLNPRKLKTQAVPVVYDRRVSSGLLGHFVGAISGAAVARGVSFLKDKMGESGFADG